MLSFSICLQLHVHMYTLYYGPHFDDVIQIDYCTCHVDIGLCTKYTCNFKMAPKTHICTPKYVAVTGEMGLVAFVISVAPDLLADSCSLIRIDTVC